MQAHPSIIKKPISQIEPSKKPVKTGPFLNPKPRRERRIVCACVGVSQSSHFGSQFTQRKTLAMESKFFHKVAMRSAIASRLYYTSGTNKPNLYSKISPHGSPSTSVVPDLEDWVYKGNKIRVAELQRIIRDLRKRKRFTHALEVVKFLSKSLHCTNLWLISKRSTE